MVKEALRWTRMAPFGVPHASSEDDWYEGMFIPKGTIIIPNTLVINSDPTVFGSDPARFNPSRYLDEKGQMKMRVKGHEEGHVTFGFGRRICPGRFVAEGTLAIDFATLLWAMRFERSEGAQGELDTQTLIYIGIGACVFFHSFFMTHNASSTRITVSPYLSNTRPSPGLRKLKFYLRKHWLCTNRGNSGRIIT